MAAGRGKMNVEQLIKTLEEIKNKNKSVLDNNSNEIENIHESEGVIYLEPADCVNG